jgi:hypothetical protein
MPELQLTPEQTFSAALSRRHRAGRRHPPATAIAAFVRSVSEAIDELNTRAGLDQTSAQIVRGAVLNDAFVPLLCVREGATPLAARLLADRWTALAGQKQRRRSPRASVQPITLRPDDTLLLETFASRVMEELIATSRADRGRRTIQWLMGALRLSLSDVGRMVGVSDETVRRWARGATGIPEAKLAILDVGGAALARLLRLVRPDRLPEVIRRPADAFGGQRAFDWILQGRVREVADQYERELAYQA